MGQAGGLPDPNFIRGIGGIQFSNHSATDVAWVPCPRHLGREQFELTVASAIEISKASHANAEACDQHAATACTTALAFRGCSQQSCPTTSTASEDQLGTCWSAIAHRTCCQPSTRYCVANATPRIHIANNMANSDRTNGLRVGKASGIAWAQIEEQHPCLSFDQWRSNSQKETRMDLNRYRSARTFHDL